MATNMTFTDYQTIIPADWLNNVNNTVNYTAAYTGAVTRALNGKTAEILSVKDFGATGSGVSDDTVAIQAAITAANAIGGFVFFPPGRYLCGSLNVNAQNGGTIFAIPNTAHLIPNGNNVAFFTLTNAQIFGVGYTIDGLVFDNSARKTNTSGVVVADYEHITVRNIVVIQMGYVIAASATSGGGNSYNFSLENVTQYGSGSYSWQGLGTRRCFDTHISNVNQFSTGGDTWIAPWFTFVRTITGLLTNVHGQSLGGTTIGVRIIGSCEGIFLSNVVIPFPSYGILCDLSNGDVTPPSWIYLSNVGVDQTTINAVDILANFFRWSNGNITGGTFRQNIGSGLIIRPNAFDISIFGVQVNGMYNDGLTLQSGATQVRFDSCSFTQNNGSGGAFSDVDVVANTAIDPNFSNCLIGTQKVNGTSVVINGGSTSRYVNSQRMQALSNGTSNQVLATYALPANSFVDGKTIKISTSGSCAANGNLKTIYITIGGVVVGTMTGNYNNTSWAFEGEVFRVDSNNIWLVAKAWNGATSNVTSVLQNPFNSAIALTLTLTTTTTAASDVSMHHFDVELVS